MKARKLSLCPVLALLAVVGMTMGCARKTDDAKIASSIQSDFSADSGLQGKQVSVQSQNGVVTLSGSVDNDAQRTAASRYAAAVPGVKEVVNDLEIGALTTPADAGQAQSLSAPPRQPVPEPENKPRPRLHHRHDAPPENDAQKQTQPLNQTAQEQQPTMPATADLTTPGPFPPLPPPPPPPPQKVTIPSGTTIAVRLVDPVGSDTSQQGQVFHATLNAPLAVGGEVAIPAGYSVEGHVVDVENGGKFTGKAQLTLQLDRVIVGGKHYDLQTDTYHRETKSRGTNTAEKVGAGSVLGAIIGGIAGGGKGAAIGAAAGGGVGGGAQAAGKAPQVRLPSESVLTFTLQAPLIVLPTQNGPDAGRPKLDAAQPQPGNAPNDDPTDQPKR